MAVFDVDKLISQARRLAADYRQATGKSLPISSEIAKHDACTQLQLTPVEDESTGGFDATGDHELWKGHRIQIKGRAIFDESKTGQRIGQLKLDKEWDSVVLVIMDAEFASTEMYMASKKTLLNELGTDDSSRKNRGAMSIAKFKHVGQLVWSAHDGMIAVDPFK